jgi:hypothetical protein
LHQTGGRRIVIRGRIGLRSGKVGNRSPYRGRIGDGPDLKKWGSGRWYSKGVNGVRHRLLRTGFFILPAGKISGIFVIFFFVARKISGGFFETFLENIFFSVRNYF